VREAIGSRRVLRLDYRDSGGKPSERDVWPLALYYWAAPGPSAPGASGEQTSAISASTGSRASRRSSALPDEAGKRLADFIRAMEAR